MAIHDGAGLSLLYDDNELRVIWRQGFSDFLFISFGDLSSLASGLRFFADQPAARSDWSTLAFVAKRGNWYPRENMAAAWSSFADRLAAFHRRVVFGNSMGGYGALKYSGRLRAETVVALAPQWSLDPAECGGVDPTFQQYFLASMRGMGVRADEVSGHIYIVADRYDPVERFHCARIAQNCPGVQFIDAPGADHQVAALFAGSGNFSALIDLARAGDLDALRALVRERRRATPAFRARIDAYLAVRRAR